MAEVTTFQTPAARMPRLIGGITPFIKEFSVVSGDASNGDTITIGYLPAGMRIVDSKLSVSASLGAGCTVKLRVGTTDLTAATTAAQANVLDQSVFAPAAGTSAQAINLLVGGADIAASANIKVLVQMADD